MKINEIFYSIQGEGIYTGVPMVFVRFQGCNLLTGCSWCDTQYARREGGFDMALEDVIRRVSFLSPFLRAWVCITGGEPLFHEEDLKDLVYMLSAGHYKVEVETNGTIVPPSWMSKADSWAVDVKTPSSGIGAFEYKWLEVLRLNDQVKFVVADENDLDFARTFINRNLRTKPATVLISPMISAGFSADCVNWAGVEGQYTWLQGVAEFCKEERVRMSLQLHKIIWGSRKGV